jgi:hypothetical protein
MTYTVMPTAIEITNPDNPVAARVEVFDEVSSEVELVDTVNTAESWRELSAAIESAIVQLNLDGSK